MDIASCIHLCTQGESFWAFTGPWPRVQESVESLGGVQSKRQPRDTLLVDWTSQLVRVVKNLPAKASRHKRLKFNPWVIPPGGGHGNPFMYSCLENPMDRGAWQAAVHRVTQNQTRLKWFSTHWLSPVLVISCYIKNHPKLSVLAWQIFTNTISVDQESGSDLVGEFWLRISHVVAGKGPLGLQASQGLNRIRIISKQTHQLLGGPGPLPHGHFHQLPEGSYNTVVVPLSPGLPDV